jgi:hypothetical protein
MILSSSDIKSVVGLSENSLYEHYYSSISQCTSGLSADREGSCSVLSELQHLHIKYYPVSGSYSLQSYVSIRTTTGLIVLGFLFFYTENKTIE